MAVPAIDRAALHTVDRPELGSLMTLPDGDRNGPLRKRLEARESLERVDLTEASASGLPRSIAEIALDRHVTGTRTLVVLNTVRLAQDTFARLAKQADGPPVVLLHSRFRPPRPQASISSGYSP